MYNKINLKKKGWKMEEKVLLIEFVKRVYQGVKWNK